MSVSYSTKTECYVRQKTRPKGSCHPQPYSSRHYKRGVAIPKPTQAKTQTLHTTVAVKQAAFKKQPSACNSHSSNKIKASSTTTQRTWKPTDLNMRALSREALKEQSQSCSSWKQRNSAGMHHIALSGLHRMSTPFVSQKPRHHHPRWHFMPTQTCLLPHGCTAVLIAFTDAGWRKASEPPHTGLSLS